MSDIETFGGVTIGPGTLYNAITRLVEKELIAPLEGDGRQRPYKLTARGTAALDQQLQNMRRIASIGLKRPDSHEDTARRFADASISESLAC